MSKTEPDMKVIKAGACVTLSQKSRLSYQIATDEDSGLHVRITKNTGGGFFSNEWISMDDVRAVLEEQPEGTRVTSLMLQSLFKGKSVNTPAFLLAALAHEKLLYPMNGKKRGLVVVDSDEFTEKVAKLTSSKTANRKTPASSKKKAVTKKSVSRKAAVKRKSTARKKATTRKKTT
jgi:hypothetical protein